ncbi:hypothetical protein ACLB2K_024094 [Fragaria x ananassa]
MASSYYSFNLLHLYPVQLPRPHRRSSFPAVNRLRSGSGFPPESVTILRIRQGVLLNAGLIMFLLVVLLYVDWCAWRIVKLPLAPFHLTCPFVISVALASCAGYVCVPLLYSLKIHQIIRKEGSIRHSLKKRTPTMGGLFFVPVGVTVARFTAGFSSVEVAGVATATLAFSAIGLLDDIICLIKNHNSGLSA